jgi:hypothetical protein
MKKIIAFISVLSLVLCLFPSYKNVQAAGASVGFDGISGQTFEGDMAYVKLKLFNGFLIDPYYIDVHYTINGTADSSDYYFHDGTGVARVKAGQTAFPLYGIDEAGLELDETVIITITSATDSNGNAVAINQNAKIYTHTIKDYNGPPKLSFVYATDSSSEIGPGTFKVYLSRPALTNVTFDWTYAPLVIGQLNTQPFIINGNTFPADILNGSGRAVILAGELSTEIALGFQDDNLVEGNEQIGLFLRPNPDGAVIGAVDFQTYTIIDNDSLSISFQPAGASGSESVGNVNATVVMPNASLNNTTFSVAVDQAHSTAISGGQDWNLPLPVAQFTIPAGATSLNVGFNIIDDNQQEGNETAVLSIANAANAGGLTVANGQNMSYTYTILDNDTPVPVVPPAPPVTPPAPPTVPQGTCPALSPGDMVKVSGQPAIYVVNRFNKIMYFPSGDEYKSWNEGEGYGGYITVTQDCFDNGLNVPNTPPAGVNYRPGSYVIKKENTTQLYVVLPNNTIAKISTADAKALYGTNYRVMTVKFIFWSNYINTGADISGKVHSGMLVRNDGKVWYVDGNMLREVPDTQMATNRFKSAFIHTVPTSYLSGLNVGVPINGEIVGVTNRTQL